MQYFGHLAGLRLGQSGDAEGLGEPLDPPGGEAEQVAGDDDGDGETAQDIELVGLVEDVQGAAHEAEHVGDVHGAARSHVEQFAERRASEQ